MDRIFSGRLKRIFSSNLHKSRNLVPNQRSSKSTKTDFFDENLKPPAKIDSICNFTGFVIRENYRPVLIQLVEMELHQRFCMNACISSAAVLRNDVSFYIFYL